MEINNINPAGKLVTADKSTEGHEVAKKQLVKKKVLKVFYNRTDNGLYINGTKQLAHQSNDSPFQVTRFTSSILANKNENVQKSPLKSIVNHFSKGSFGKHYNCDVRNKPSKQCLDENKSCSDWTVCKNDYSLTVYRKQDDDSSSRDSGFPSNSSFKKINPPTLKTLIKPGNKLTLENVDSSPLDYYGHWLEIKEENNEELNEKYLPESDVYESGEKVISSVNETNCKSPDLDQDWNCFVLKKTYENKFLRSRNSQFISKRIRSQENSTVSPLVSTDAGVSPDFLGSMEDENKNSNERVVIHDENSSVEDSVDLGNEAFVSGGTETVSETLFCSEGSEDHFLTPLGYANDVLLSEPNNQFSLDKCRNEIGKVQGSTNKALAIGNIARKKNLLSDFEFFSTYADVETDEYETGQHIIEVNFAKEKTSTQLDIWKKSVSNKLAKFKSFSASHEEESWQCVTCLLFFPSCFLLNKHRISLKHFDTYESRKDKEIFKQAPCLKNNLQMKVCIQFQCSVCKITFSNKDLLADHIPSHFVVCQVCGITYKSKYALKVHNKRCIRPKTYSCLECNKSFNSSKLRTMHLRSCHTDKYPKLACSLCKSSFDNKASLIYHWKTHLQVKAFHCSDCGEGFVFKKQLRQHVVKHKKTDNSFTCSVCSKTFRTRYYLKQHIETHSGKKPHACAECGRCFLRIDNLRCHMQLHEGEKKYHCEICKGSFFSRPSLTMHMTRHLSGLPMSKYLIKCVICCLDKRQLKTSLKTHLKQHTLRPKVLGTSKFVCHICDYKFKSKQSLCYHLNLHRNLSPFKCVKCKTVFKHFVSSLSHSYLHLRTKKFLCKVCKNQFSFMKGLQEHLKVHYGKNLYKCSECKQCFPGRLVLVRHLKRHVEERHLHCAVEGETSVQTLEVLQQNN